MLKNPEETDTLEEFADDSKRISKEKIKEIVKKYYSHNGKYAFSNALYASIGKSNKTAKGVMEESMAKLWAEAIRSLKGEEDDAKALEKKGVDFNALKHSVTKPPVGLNKGQILGPLMSRLGGGKEYYGGIWSSNSDFKHRDDVINKVLFCENGGTSIFDAAYDDKKTGWENTLKVNEGKIKEGLPSLKVNEGKIKEGLPVEGGKKHKKTLKRKSKKGKKRKKKVGKKNKKTMKKKKGKKGKKSKRR